MCDTLYCAPRPGRDGISFFGKNSDRHPAEPQTLCLVPARAASAELDLGGRKLGVPDKGLAYLLSKPSWIWGGEMGVNAAGVAMGNEAVFSRFRPAKDGILGMDILRAALANASTAREAVDFVCAFVEKHDQGGNGAFKGSLHYDNSFLVTDPGSAYLLETAGRRWAWREAGSVDAISNAYCIGKDYKRLDAQSRKAIFPINEHLACAEEGEAGRRAERGSFKEHVENRLYLGFTKGEERRALSLSSLAAFAAAGLGREAIGAFLDVLRSHGPYDPRAPWSGHMKSLCVHAGGIPRTATTASLAVEYRGPEAALVWFSGSPNPCLSLYKPILLHRGQFHPLWTAYDYAEGSAAAQAYWERCALWVRSSRAGALSLDPGFVSVRDQAQGALALIADSALADLEASGEAASLAVLAQEAGAVIAGWEKDRGLGGRGL